MSVPPEETRLRTPRSELSSLIGSRVCQNPGRCRGPESLCFPYLKLIRENQWRINGNHRFFIKFYQKTCSSVAKRPEPTGKHLCSITECKEYIWDAFGAICDVIRVISGKIPLRIWAGNNNSVNYCR